MIKNFLNKSPFLKSVTLLVGGTGLGQLISIAAMPILTRLYGPESFSVLAVYSSTLSLLTVIACLRFEIAIPLPKNDIIGAALTVLSLGFVLIFSILSGLIVFLVPDIINKLTNYKISQFLWLLPLGIFTIGMYNALQYWSTRKKKFLLISKTRVSQSLTGTSIKLGSGYLFSGHPFGLMLGQLISQGAGFLSFLSSILKNDIKIFKSIKMSHYKVALARFSKFPKFSTFEAFANTGGIQIPIILITYFAVGTEAGFLMIAIQLLSAPMGLIGDSIAQVYLAEGADRYHKNELKAFTHKTIKNLAKISIVPLLIAGFVSPFLMPYLLGNNWNRTGILISWMIPWFFMQFITSPISMSLHITGNQITAFILQLSGLVIRVGSVLIAGFFYKNLISEFYAVSGFIFYLIYLVVILKILSKVQHAAK